MVATAASATAVVAALAATVLHAVVVAAAAEASAGVAAGHLFQIISPIQNVSAPGNYRHVGRNLATCKPLQLLLPNTSVP